MKTKKDIWLFQLLLKWRVSKRQGQWGGKMRERKSLQKGLFHPFFLTFHQGWNQYIKTGKKQADWAWGCNTVALCSSPTLPPTSKNTACDKVTVWMKKKRSVWRPLRGLAMRISTYLYLNIRVKKKKKSQLLQRKFQVFWCNKLITGLILQRLTGINHF